MESKANRICDFRDYFLFSMSKWGKERSLQEAFVDDDAYSLIVVKTGDQNCNERIQLLHCPARTGKGIIGNARNIIYHSISISSRNLSARA